jgi:CsoR family transcriptional regulator, copper-sensing transcriptional repressor
MLAGMAHGYAEHKPSLIKRLHRIEGQVRGIERMVEDDRYCIDILTQLGAVSTALESLSLEILDDHVQHCVAGALASGDKRAAKEKTEELLAAVRRFAKTL